jgi:hypothetical protein
MDLATKNPRLIGDLRSLVPKNHIQVRTRRRFPAACCISSVIVRMSRPQKIAKGRKRRRFRR